MDTMKKVVRFALVSVVTGGIIFLLGKFGVMNATSVTHAAIAGFVTVALVTGGNALTDYGLGVKERYLAAHTVPPPAAPPSAPTGTAAPAAPANP